MEQSGSMCAGPFLSARDVMSGGLSRCLAPFHRVTLKLRADLTPAIREFGNVFTLVESGLRCRSESTIMAPPCHVPKERNAITVYSDSPNCCFGGERYCMICSAGSEVS